MPELPAVEYTRKLIELNALKRRVYSICFTGNKPDELIFSERASEFVETIVGYQVEEVGRWGKQLWITLRKEKDEKLVALLIHLGMTGFVQFEGSDRLKYESSPSRDYDATNWPPKFTKFLLEFTQERSEEIKKMAFCDSRRFGRVDLIELGYDNYRNVRSSIVDKLGLGFDPLLSMPPLIEFQVRFTEHSQKRKINVKALLMEQGFVAGLGNWMVDDILMLARIHPKRTLSTLTDKEIKKLHNAIKELTVLSVGVDADKSKFPKDWLFHIRWNHGKETLTGLEVKSEKISGRTTFWIPKLQN